MQQAAPLSPEAYADALLQSYLSPATDDAPAVWTAKYAEEVAKRRESALEKTLLYDRLLAEANVEASLFPPSSPSDTYVLLVAILTAAVAEDEKSALLYYLFKEHAGEADGDVFAEHVALSPSKRAEIDGYWGVDHALFASAIPYLKDARFLPIVAETLGGQHKHAALLLELYDVQGSLPATCGTPSEATLHQLALLLEALAQVRGLGTAWVACRQWLAAQPNAQALHNALYGVLLRYCFAPPRPDAIRALLALPLDADEEGRVQNYALTPGSAAPSHAAVAVDTLLLKLINEGRYVDAIHLDRRAAQLERSHAFGSDGSSQAARLRHRRKALVDGVWSILPAVQRDALVADLGPEPMAEEAQPAAPERPQTPLSASLSAAPAKASPDARLLYTAVHLPSLGQKRGATPALRESDAPLRSSSPFAGWKRAAPRETQKEAPRPLEPGWGVPIPKMAQDVAMDEARAVEEDMDDALDEAEAVNEDEPMADEADEADEADADDEPVDDEPVDVDEPADEPEDEHADPSPSPEVPRRRRGSRRAAKKANEALRMTLRSEDPPVPGGFPMEAAPARRTRRTSRAPEEGLTASASMYPTAQSPAPRLPRSATQGDVAYPQASLARLEALHDHRPIARRTRAQTAELESHGSQASDVGDLSDFAHDEPATPSRRRRRASPVATPQRVTRSSRRLKDGTTPGTPRSVPRRRDGK
ncbi:uncharacterized protein MJAP1_003573 [Malassezia japonica]|uniref:ELYS-like domain-containing protein n=1 Tax=Malassezia japonica TaxID=223818 RepID=A0AAF0F0N2_9BASI|nr:uncharacterized protein MJAP1_003573 [Malassezia japonica]WFD40585.1 hypothetical protein MJAP1_003573 [Malassezia japonica]